jgi:hypothetical protein
MYVRFVSMAQNNGVFFVARYESNVGRGRETEVSCGGRIGKTEGFPEVRYRIDGTIILFKKSFDFYMFLV